MMCISKRDLYRQWLLFATMLIACSCGSSAASRLDTMFARGDSAIAVEWTPDSLNTRSDWYFRWGAKCTGEDSTYLHCDFLAGQTYRSIAYSYGGEDSAPTFRSKLKRGLRVGSHQCHYKSFGDPSDTIAGTDCSGFLCYLWGISRVSTNDLYSKYTVITRGELDVGDILVKPGSHVVLVVEREDSTHFLIWESTSAVNGCRERSITITDTTWNSYYPRRFPALTMGVTPATTQPRNDLFPRITWSHSRLGISTDGNWRGTVTLYSLLGKRVASVTCTAGQGNPVSLAAPATSGVVIVDMLNEHGERKRLQTAAITQTRY